MLPSSDDALAGADTWCRQPVVCMLPSSDDVLAGADTWRPESLPVPVGGCARQAEGAADRHCP
jgi:hypothetical protein